MARPGDFVRLALLSPLLLWVVFVGTVVHLLEDRADKAKPRD